MKNKRILTAFLAALLLATTFASCSRRDKFRPDETDAPTGEQTTVAGQPDVNNPGESNPTDTNQSGGDVTDPNTTTPDIPIVTPPVSNGENGKITGNPYEGWTAEELYASFMEDQERSIYNNVNDKLGNTPYYVILDVRNGGSMFSKLTGQVVQICKDPICDHENCIFSMLQLLSCLVVDDRCYLLMSGFKGDVYATNLYSFDLLMNDVKLVCEWSGADAPRKAHIYNDKLYYSTEMKFDDGQYDRVTMVYDINEKTTAPLHQEPIRSSVIWYEGAYEWYTPRSDGSLRRYNMDTGEDEEILSSSLLNYEEGETGFCYMGSIGQKVYVMKYSTAVGFTNCKEYDLETGNMQDIGDTTVLLYDDMIYQGVRHNVTEYKNDPHYEYYSTKDNAGCIYGGKFFQRDSKTGELHEVVNLSTDGIPDCLMNFCILDGNFLMIKYQTYKDFQNPYSPSIIEWARSDRYVVVNMETGTVYELGVDLSDQSYHKWLEKHEKHER